MEILNLVRLVAGTLLIAVGVLVFIIETIGVFRYKYTLDRMHFSGMGDTLGLLSLTAGAIIINGINFTGFKLVLVLVFFWFTSPVSSHLISRLVTDTDERLKDNCEEKDEQ